MRAIAMTGLLLAAFPAVMQLATGFWSIESGFADFVYGWLIMITGFILPMMLTRKLLPDYEYINSKKFKTFKKLIFAGMVVIPILAAIIIYDGSKAFFYALSGMLYFYLGIKGYYREYFEILNQKAILTGIFLCLVSVIETTAFSKCAIYENVVLYFVYAFIIIAAVVINQNSMDIAVRTNGTAAAGKARIRFFNIFCVVVILLTILAVVNYTSSISVIKSVYDFIKSFPSYLMGMSAYLVYIFGFLTRKRDKLPESLNKEQGSIDSFNDLQAKTGNPIFTVIAIVVFLIVVAVLLFIFGRRLTHWFKEKILKRVISFFKYLNSIISSFFAVDDADEEKYYIDEFSKVQKIRHIDKGQKEYKKKTARSFGHIDMINDPVEKIRYIFGLIIESLVHRGVDITKSDTVGEINEKAPQELKEGGHFKDVSEIYSKTRYGEIIPDEAEVKKARDTCKELLQKM